MPKRRSRSDRIIGVVLLATAFSLVIMGVVAFLVRGEFSARGIFVNVLLVSYFGYFVFRLRSRSRSNNGAHNDVQ